MFVKHINPTLRINYFENHINVHLKNKSLLNLKSERNGVSFSPRYSLNHLFTDGAWILMSIY